MERRLVPITTVRHLTQPNKARTISNCTLFGPLMQLTPQEEQQERENGELLASMMGDNIDPDVARRVLRKHNGNIQKAADAILEGDRGENVVWNSAHSQAGHDLKYLDSPPASNNQHITQVPPSTVIDLTSDEDELSRALHLSMESSQTEIKFGPSDRAPDPAWQVVPSNVSLSLCIILGRIDLTA